ncbi:MAG: glycosyltransferase family 9 protein [Candidatus Kapaibacterium sp.]
MKLSPREVIRQAERVILAAPKRLLYALLDLVVHNPRPAQKLEPSRVQRVLLIRNDRVGDMIITLPTIAYLRKVLPHADIDVLASRSNARVAEACPEVSTVIIQPQTLLAKLRLWRMLRQRNYHLILACVTNRSTGIGLLCSYLTSGVHTPAVDTASQHSSATAFSRSKGISATIHRGDKYDRFFHVQSREAARQPNAARKLLMVIPDVINCVVEESDAAPRMAVPQANLESAVHFLNSNGLRPGSYGLVNISVRTQRNAWTDQGFVRALDTIAERSGMPALLLAMPSDIERAHALATQATSAIVIPASNDVLDAAALVKFARIVLSPDTAVVHMCSAFGIPMLGLYCHYSQGTDEWGPVNNTGARVLTPKSGNVVAQISPEEMDLELRRLWDET